MKTLFLDTETFCETPINHGTHRYAESVEVMLAQWAWNDGPVNVVEFPDGAMIQALVDERVAAKAARDFARADAIRQQLTAEGIVLEDTPAGVRWKRA